MGLSTQDIDRYSRQLILPRWSAELQEQLGKTSILLESHLSGLALYAAGLGIGRIVMSDTSDENVVSSFIRRLNPSCVVDVANLEEAETFSCVFTTKNTGESADSEYRVRIIEEGSPRIEYYDRSGLLFSKPLPGLRAVPLSDIAGPLALMGYLEARGF